MTKRLILFALLLCAPAMWGAVCTSQAGGGNWDVGASIWSCGHVPTSSDNVVIATSNPVTVENGLSTAAVTAITFTGASPSLTVAAGGTLNVVPAVNATAITLAGAGVVFTNNGTANIGNTGSATAAKAISVANGTVNCTSGTFVLYGDLYMTSGTNNLNLYGCQVTFKPTTGAYFQVYVGGTTTYRFCSTSACDGTGAEPNGLLGTYTPTVFNTDTSNGGTNFIFYGPGATQIILWDGVEVRNCGSSSAICLTYGSVSNPGNTYFRHTLFYNSGQVNPGLHQGYDFAINHVTLINPLYVGQPVFTFNGASAPTGSELRQVFNLATYSPYSSVTNLAAYNRPVSITGQKWVVGQSKMLGDPADNAGIVSYNSMLSATNANSLNGVWRNSIFSIDAASGAAYSCLVINPGSSVQLNETTCFTAVANSHFDTGSATNAGAANQIVGNVFDGNNQAQNDNGDNCLEKGTNIGYICNNNFHLNNSGTVFTIGNVGGQQLTFMNNTAIMSQGGSAGEGYIDNATLVQLRNNLFVTPMQAIANASLTGVEGFHGQHSFVSQGTQFSLDYNYYCGIGGSGDTCSGVVAPASIIDVAPALISSTSNQRGYWSYLTPTAIVSSTTTTGTGSQGSCSAGQTQVVAVASTFAQIGSGTTLIGNYQIYSAATSPHIYRQIVGWISNTTVCVSGPAMSTSQAFSLQARGFMSETCTTSGVDPTRVLTCSTADFVNGATQVGDVVYSASSSGTLTSPYATVASVTDGTHLVLSSTPAGYSPLVLSATLTNLNASPWNQAGWLYGDSNNGSHDQHVDPNLRDANATVCTWWADNTGRARDVCSTRIYLVSNYTGTTVTITGGVPTGWNVGDPVKIYSGNTATERGEDTIQAINTGAGTITLTSGIAGVVASDQIANEAAIVGVGRAMVTINGFNYLGNPCSGGSGDTACAPWATPMNLMSYLRWRLTPMNGMFKNAAKPSDCNPASLYNTCDIGATASYVAANN